MVGQYKVVVENVYLRYEFTIKRNLTVIRGDSATGKTTLAEMIRNYYESDDSGVKVLCEKNLAVINGRNWRNQIAALTDTIIFLDEQNRFVKTEEFAETIKSTDNYYVIISREKLSMLPYSVTEVYGIRNSGKYAGFMGEYTQNEFFRLYGETPARRFKADIVITEDSNAGFEFWTKFFNVKCDFAGGKSNVLLKLRQIADSQSNYLAIVDGAAFGPEMEQMLQYIKYENPRVEIYAPESFEYLILNSNIFKDNKIKEKCIWTENYADSTQYMSWEQFYTHLLISTTENTNMAYSKRKLNPYYLSEYCIALVGEAVPKQIKE